MNSKSNGGQQPSWRYWGEETIDGAVFTVYLKKVRYFNASKVIHSDSEDEIAHLEWETVRVRMMKAGTLERFVECMSTENGELDSTYVNVFLATYRTFATTKQVLDQLLDRYQQIGAINGIRENSQDLLRKTIRLVLTVWLDTYPDDFRVPPNYDTLNKLLEFAVENLPDNELELRTRHKLEKFHKEDGLKDLTSFDSTANKVFKNPPVNGVSGVPAYNFIDYPTELFAQQLTCIDANLFKQLRPHHCLGAVWARRERTRNSEASSVVATIEQFNAVSFRVISTILSDSELKPLQRSKIISKWVDIAQMLRMLKNFSSLKAIICGLQSNPIYRLKKTWLSMPREKVELFEEMARIFSEDNNQMACRELLMKEGTAKVAEMVGENDRHLLKCIQKQQCNGQSTIQGTVPYLGTFLTDLTMIDTAIPDICPDGLINFDKKRKEFEVIAQIKLLQSAANSYQITTDPSFQPWFNSLPILDDKESYDMSCHIEPNGSGSVSKDRRPCHKLGFGHKKSDSIASTSSSSSSSQFYDQVSDTISIPSSPNDSSSLERKMSTSSSSSSLPSLDASMSSATSATVGQIVPPSPLQTPDFYIIRVSLDNNGLTETEGVILYKSIMLANNERTPTVIRNAMMKHNIEGDPDDYCLAQILSDGEMVFPNNANVYYAMSTAHDLNFILRLRKHDDMPGVKKTKQPKSKKKISLSV